LFNIPRNENLLLLCRLSPFVLSLGLASKVKSVIPLRYYTETAEGNPVDDEDDYAQDCPLSA
jgi:hypothetical protein